MKPADNLRIALLQSELVWHSPEQNMAAFAEKLRALPKGGFDLIVLPEMFTSGFTMEPETIAEPDGGPAHQWLAEMSNETGAAVCGSVAALSDGKYYNRLLWAESGHTRPIYDKRHLFRMAGEQEIYTAGTASEMVILKGWKILPRICYDLRFPVWNRSSEAHLQLYTANWPAARVDAWDKLAMARSIENLCYTAVVNRVGTDGKGIDYSGHSAVYDFKGNPMEGAPEGREAVVTAVLSMDELARFREKFPAHLDADRFTLLT
ncbi:MAG: amidohydrolase [Cryomorphaceae bacterium]